MDIFLDHSLRRWDGFHSLIHNPQSLQINRGIYIMEYLVFTALGPNKPEIISQISLLAAKNDCNIEQSRITAMGSEIAAMILISGNWNTIAKMEAGLASLEKELNLAISIKRTKPQAMAEEMLPYEVQVVALDHPGITYEVTSFFARQNIIIYDLQTSTYTSRSTGSSMFSLDMRVGIPGDLSLADMREQFLLMCDDLNLDGSIEPEKI